VVAIDGTGLVLLGRLLFGQQVGQRQAIVRAVERGIERQRLLLSGALVGLPLADQIRELVADDLRHVAHGRRIGIGCELPSHHDPVRQALLHQIVELLPREASRPPSELTHQLLRKRDLPSLETLSRLERHDSPRRLPDGEEIERGSAEGKERQVT
jgi:hypothetical protein